MVIMLYVDNYQYVFDVLCAYDYRTVYSSEDCMLVYMVVIKLRSDQLRYLG